MTEDGGIAKAAMGAQWKWEWDDSRVRLMADGRLREVTANGHCTCRICHARRIDIIPGLRDDNIVEECLMGQCER